MPFPTAFTLQYYTLISGTPKKYETVAHFYETASLYFGKRTEKPQLCPYFDGFTKLYHI